MNTHQLVAVAGVMMLTAPTAWAFSGTHRGLVAGLGFGGMMMYSDEHGEGNDFRLPAHATFGFGLTERLVLTGDVFFTDFERVGGGFFMGPTLTASRAYFGYTGTYFPGEARRSLMIGAGIGWYTAQVRGPERLGIHVIIGYELWHLQMGLTAPCLITNVVHRPRDAPRILPGFFVRAVAF